jgi:hypothetical protein
MPALAPIDHLISVSLRASYTRAVIHHSWSSPALTEACPS